MILYSILLLLSSGISFALGWITGRRKFSNETAVLVIDNLKAQIQLYKVAHEEQMARLSQKYTELKIDVLKCMEENKLLKEEIRNLKNKK